MLKPCDANDFRQSRWKREVEGGGAHKIHHLELDATLSLDGIHDDSDGKYKGPERQINDSGKRHPR